MNLTAHRVTANLLADALDLSGTARTEFERAATGQSAVRRQVTAAGVGGLAAATRTLPRDAASLTGREIELGLLMAAAVRAADRGEVVGIYAIGGMAGIGKTTFAVRAAHMLAESFPDGQIFLPLHGHTPGQRPVEPSEVLARASSTKPLPSTARRSPPPARCPTPSAKQAR